MCRLARAKLNSLSSFSGFSSFVPVLLLSPGLSGEIPEGSLVSPPHAVSLMTHSLDATELGECPGYTDGEILAPMWQSSGLFCPLFHHHHRHCV